MGLSSLGQRKFNCFLFLCAQEAKSRFPSTLYVLTFINAPVVTNEEELTAYQILDDKF